MKDYDKDPNRYEDILYLPHHVSSVHPPMSMLNRAAQFSPFAALTGYEGQIVSAQQPRCHRVYLSDEEKKPIHAALSGMKKHDRVNVLHFVEDPGTDGAGGFAEGRYQETIGEVLQIHPEYQSFRIGTEDGWIDVDYEEIRSLTFCEL